MNSDIRPFRGGKNALSNGKNSYKAIIGRLKIKAERAHRLGDYKSEEENKEKAEEFEKRLEIKIAATKRLIGECG